MESYCLKFLIAYSILLTGIEGRIVVPPSLLNTIGDKKLLLGFSDLINRLDQLEAKVEQHEVKINSQQLEIDQLKIKNFNLEAINHQLTLKAIAKEDYVISRTSSLPRSCFELKAMNPNAASGVYSIDPDGQIGVDPPIKVHCDMSTQTTSIYHDTEAKTEITSCLDPGCYTKAITYNATVRQLAKLADISASCKQHIRFDSFSVPLEYKNEQQSYWNDRNGGKQIFWAGPASSQHTCQCGIEKNCVERNYKCNADALAPIKIFDEGYITATELLPVTRLNFGRTSLAGVKASYTLGRFECTGQAPISSKPTSCLDLFKMGHTLNGFYDIKGGSNQIASTFCNFSKSSIETGYETRYGFVDVKSSPVHFYTTRISNWNTTGTILYEKEYLNLGGGMNLASGVFTAPKDGTYAFVFKGEGSAGGGFGTVCLTLNNSAVACGSSKVIHDEASAYLTIFVQATLKLNKGNIICTRLDDGAIASSSYSFIQFSGSLLEEDLAIA